MTETGISIFNQKLSGAFAFGALCALEYIGIVVGCISVSYESAISALLFQKGFTLEDGVEFISLFEKQDYNLKHDSVKQVLKMPDKRETSVLILTDNRILSQDDKARRVFGDTCEKIQNNIELIINRAAESEAIRNKKLLWILSASGVRKIISIEGEKYKTYSPAGKTPLWTFSPNNGEDKSCENFAAQGWRQILNCRQQLLDSIYFAV